LLPVAAVAIGAAVLQATIGAARASFASPHQLQPGRARSFAMTALLHLLQPFARLAGRLRHGLTPWRGRGRAALAVPKRWRWSVWSARWRPHPTWLEALEPRLRAADAVVLRGGSYDRWDLEVRGGAFGGVRLQTLVEEHGEGRQLVRLRAWPRFSPVPAAAACALGLLAAAALGVPLVAAALGAGAALIVLRLLRDSAAAVQSIDAAASRLNEEPTWNAYMEASTATLPTDAVRAGDPVVTATPGTNAAGQRHEHVAATDELAGSDQPTHRAPRTASLARPGRDT
jgi:hypothetical protein